MKPIHQKKTLKLICCLFFYLTKSVLSYYTEQQSFLETYSLQHKEYSKILGMKLYLPINMIPTTGSFTTLLNHRKIFIK